MLHLQIHGASSVNMGYNEASSLLATLYSHEDLPQPLLYLIEKHVEKHAKTCLNRSLSVTTDDRPLTPQTDHTVGKQLYISEVSIIGRCVASLFGYDFKLLGLHAYRLS